MIKHLIISVWQGRQSRDFGLAGRGRVWENTMSYFGLKVCWKVIIFQKKEKKFGMNVGLNGSFL